jgi:hypothetical protein
MTKLCCNFILQDGYENVIKLMDCVTREDLTILSTCPARTRIYVCANDLDVSDFELVVCVSVSGMLGFVLRVQLLQSFYLLDSSTVGKSEAESNAQNGEMFAKVLSRDLGVRNLSSFFKDRWNTWVAPDRTRLRSKNNCDESTTQLRNVESLRRSSLEFSNDLSEIWSLELAKGLAQSQLIPSSQADS